MVTINDYSFICVENGKLRLAKPNEMNDPKRKIVIVGTICWNQTEKATQIIEVQKYEKTYIVGRYKSYNSVYYLGKKSMEMKGFEKMVRENIPVITEFKIGYAYRPENIGKHIPCIVGKIGHEKEKQIILIESQDFEANTIKDINGCEYFVDWLSMLPNQRKNLITELNNKFPKKLKKYLVFSVKKDLKLI